jgi:polyhydroxyalkanoate synthase subunit PhaC
MSSLFSELPRYWADGALRVLNGVRRGLSDPFPVHEDPPATTPYEVIYEGGKVRLRYYPAVDNPRPIPLLVVYALIKRPFILDLQPGRSVVEMLTTQGFEVYLIDWIPPTRAESWRGFDAYVNEDLVHAVQAVQQCTGVEHVSLLGYCFGSLLTTLYTALHPATVKHLITLTLPLDMGVRTLPFYNLIGRLRPETVTLLTATYGNCPAWVMNAGFTAMAPVHHAMDKYVGLCRNQDKDGYAETFALIERWLNSDVPLAGQIFYELMTDFFQHNRLMHGDLRVGGEVVDLKNITCPVLNIIGEYDDVVHPQSSLPLVELVGSRDTHNLMFPTGHIGAVVSSAAHIKLWPQVGAWLKERDDTGN